MPIDDTRSFSIEERSSAKGELTPGALAAGYIIKRFIARGGCGSVYEAEDPTLQRRVAVKVLHLSLSTMPKMVGRFTREVQIVNLLRHPNIVQIHEVGALPDGRPFYAMEYLEGKTLHEIAQARVRLPADEVLALIEPVCAALAAAHEAGIVHRDVKASNIAVCGEGDTRRVMLLDFGIAKLMGAGQDMAGLTSAGRQVGTMTIMAPEQFTGGVVDQRVDVYALGILLYRLLTGRAPFAARTPLDLARQHIEDPAPRPSQRTPLTAALDAVVLRCLEKLPERRFDSVTALCEALRAAVLQEGAGPSLPRDTTTLGVGIHIELRLQTAFDEIDEALSDDIGFVLDRAEETLKGAGFILAMTTGTVIFGVRPLTRVPTAGAAARANAIAIAQSLLEELKARPDADPRVHVDICLHVDEIVLRGGRAGELIGGALLRTETWATREAMVAVGATSEFSAELENLETTVSPTARVVLLRRKIRA